MDAVHVRWLNCPADLGPLGSGKEGFPTVTFNTCSSINKLAQHVLDGTYGARNDKTLARFDPLVQMLN